MEFNFNINIKNNIQIADLKGRLMDKNQCQDLLDKIDLNIKEGAPFVILVMDKVEYMNSSGLNVMVNILTKARSKNGEVIITALSQKVKELFLMTKLNTLFPVTENLEQAIELVQEKIKN